MSGRLLSLTSIETLSTSSDSTSPLTNEKISLSPSLSRGTFLPRSSSRSTSENCTLGVLAHRLVSNPFQVWAEQLAKIPYVSAHHEEPVNAETPCKNWNFDPERLGHFRAEYSAPAELHPAEPVTVCLQFYARFCEWEVVRFEPDFVCASHFFCKHFQYAEQVSKVQTRV